MTLSRSLRAGLIALIAVTALSPARADLKYSMQTTLLGDQAKHASSFSMTMTTYIKGGMQRQDSNMSAGPMQMSTESLTLCDKQQLVQISPLAKVYTIASLRATSALFPSPPSMGRGGPMGGGPSSDNSDNSDTGGTGTDDVTMNIDDNGPDTVNGIDAHHYTLTVATTSTGCAGNNSSTVKMEVWVANLVTGGLACPGMFGGHPAPAAAGGGGGGCHTTTTMHGDTAKLMNIFSHMMVKMIVYDKDGKPVMMNQITDYSSAPLDDSVFAIPADYQQVSQSEFSSDQSKAMMKQAMGGGFNGGGPPSDAGNNTDQTQPNTDDNSDQPKKKHGGFHIPMPF